VAFAATKDVQIPHTRSLHEGRLDLGTFWSYTNALHSEDILYHSFIAGLFHSFSTAIVFMQASCKFAHQKEELQDLPDLACTKLCNSSKTIPQKG